jgi:hypothetical protein
MEAGETDRSRRALVRVATVLGADVSERIFPNTGPQIHDRVQTPILEALLAILHPRWTRHLEVPIAGRVRGVIDIVLVDPPGLMVAGEIESGIHRLEQQIRWAHEKATAVGDLATGLGASDGARISRLLLLRSTASTREIARSHAAVLGTEFSARADDAIASLTGTAPCPARCCSRPVSSVAGRRFSTPRRAGSTLGGDGELPNAAVLACRADHPASDATRAR